MEKCGNPCQHRKSFYGRKLEKQGCFSTMGIKTPVFHKTVFLFHRKSGENSVLGADVGFDFFHRLGKARVRLHLPLYLLN